MPQISKSKLLLWGVIIFGAITSNAQQAKSFISGRIVDNSNGEVLIGAVVFDKINNIGTSTNDLGFYSIQVKNYPTQFYISYLGYKTEIIKIDSITSILNIKLSQTDNKLEEVIVHGIDTKFNKSQTSSFKLKKQELATFPSLASEVDLNQYFQLTPGVSSGGDGNSNLYVRGGGHDQNLFMIDDMPLFHVAHFGNFFSTFNADIINSATLYKGGFPAKFGGRLSSVVDIQTYNGNINEFKGNLTLGLIFAKLFINGPIKKGSSSFLLSFRKNTLNYLDFLTTDNIDFNFYDVNFKLNTKVNDRNRLFFSLYSGNDLFGLSLNDDTISHIQNRNQWGNNAASIRLNHIVNSSLFFNLIVGYSEYHFNEYHLADINYGDNTESVYYENDFYSEISDVFLKVNSEYTILNNVKLSFGYEGNAFNFNPGNAHITRQYPGMSNIDEDFGYLKYSSFENNLFGELNFENTKNFFGNIGIRPSLLVTETNSVFSFQPRLTIGRSIRKNLDIKASYMRVNQPFHVLTATSSGFVTDYRIPVLDIAPPSLSQQYVFGINYQLHNSYELSAEFYTKNFKNLVLKKPGNRYTLDYNTWENTIETNGRGLAKGIELLIRKKEGRLTGWIGYTHQKSTRIFENVNNGEAFPFDYDRPNEINFYTNYSISKRTNFGFAWTYATGIPANIPKLYFTDTNDRYVFIYDGYNSSRQKDYHRLDINFNVKGKKNGSWNFSIINLYNRRNTYYYEVFINNNKPKINDYSLYTILPSVSYKLEF